MFRKMKMSPRFLWAAFILSTGMILTACSMGQETANPQAQAIQITRVGRLTPFLSSTPSQTVSVSTPTNPPPVPTLTPTPRTYEVKQGDDMFGIALRHGVTLDELMAANPDVLPNFLSIGTLLVIPASSQPPPESEETVQPPTPTPVALVYGSLTCSRSKEGGVWCFLPVQNDQSFPVEGIAAIFSLADQNTQTVLMQPATLPLDILAPGARLPLAAYFPPPVPEPFQVSAEILSALPNPDDGRYLPVRLTNQKILMGDNGISATIELDVSLDIAGSSAQRVWVAAVAYALDGSVVGVRRWEYDNPQPLVSEQSLPVQFDIYSVSDRIERIELLAQARP